LEGFEVKKILKYVYVLVAMITFVGQYVTPMTVSAADTAATVSTQATSTQSTATSDVETTTSSSASAINQASSQSSMVSTNTSRQAKSDTASDTVATKEKESSKQSDKTKNVKEDAGIQVGIDMSDPIKPAQKTTATVTIQGSEGAMSEGSILMVEIPTNVVSSAGINLDAAKLDGFDGPVLQRVGDVYRLVYTKNSDPIAGGEQATITWQAPLWHKGENPDSATAKITYTDAKDASKNTSDSDKSGTEYAVDPTVPSLAKWTLMAKTDDIPNYTDVALMNPNHPTSNVYTLAVNYAKSKMTSVVVNDTLPADTHFENPDRSVQTADLSTVNNVRILKATAFNGSNWPTSFKNVTSQYASAISVSGRHLSVNFGGTMKDGSAYVVEYAVAADKGQTQATYGVKQNQSSMSYTDENGKTATIGSNCYQAIDDNSNGSFTLTKDVTQTQYIAGSKYLDYTIKIKNNKHFMIPAGSTIEDPLIDGLTYVSTEADSNNIDPTPTVNGQSVTWKITKDLNTGESATIHFKVKVDEGNFSNGDEIDNEAILHRSGSKDIRTNTSSVYVYNGKIKINKTDADTGAALASAEFDILDQDGKVVDHLKTNSEGTITSKTLPEGDYTVQETKAPKGYEISDKKYTVHLDYEHAQKGVVSLDVTNVAETSDTTSTTDTTSSTDTTSTTDTTSSSDTTSTTDTTSSSDTTSTTDTTSSSDTTSTTDTTSSSDTTSTTDTTSSSDTTSTTDTTSSSDTTSTTDTTSSSDTTSTTDTTSSSDTTSTTDTTSSSDTTSTTDTTSSSDTTSTTDTTSSSDTTSTTDTTSSSDTTSTTDTTTSSDATSTTDTTTSSDTTSTTDTISSTDTTKSTESTNSTSSTSDKHHLVPGKHDGSSSHHDSSSKDDKKSLLPQTGEQVTWTLTIVGVILLAMVGWFVFRKKH
jgi:LPXTG-motif cell wall-anchored protein